jgi:nitronate monooxygenase
MRTPLCEQLGIDHPIVQAPIGPVAARASGEPIVRSTSATPAEGMTGDVDALSLWAGQSVSLAREVQPAAAIVAELVSRL